MNEQATGELAPERQFDFWLGEWDCAWGEDGRGTNRVARILDGRVIQEQFDARPGDTFRGMSVSVYSARAGEWRQTWVDTTGNYWNFRGGMEDGRMVLATDDTVEGRPVRLRMVWYNIAQDALDWNWERSDDGGRTWTLQWHISYTRKAA